MYKIPPVAGQQYTIVKGDTLWDISSFVYGNAWKYTVIWDANKSHMKSNDPHDIYPGEILWIPPDTDKSDFPAMQSSKKPGGKSSKGGKDGETDKYSFELVISGKTVPNISGSVTTTFDTPSDGFACKVRYLDKGVYELLKPYSYAPCKVLIGGVSMGSMILYNTAVAWDSGSGIATVEAFSPTVDIIDSVAEPPFEARGMTLRAWIKKLVEPFGVSIKWMPSEDKPMKRVKIGKTERIFDHINRLVRERGLVISCDQKGGLLIHEAPLMGDVVANLTEGGGTILANGGISFDGRGRFRNTIGYSSKPRRNISRTVVTGSINRNRTQAIIVEGTDEADIDTAIFKAERESVEKSLSISIPNRDWYNDRGELYAPGQFITVQSKKLYLDKPTQLMVKSVQFISESSSKSCILTVVPSSVYNRKEVENPWSTV